MSVGKVQPEFIRRLLLLERFLKGTPDEYLKEDFHPHVQALRINLSGNEDLYRRNLEACRERLEEGFAEIVPYAADGFPDAVRALSTFLDTFSESKDLVTNMDSALKRDKEMLDVNTGDVHAMYYRSVRLTESIRILDDVEYTMGVLNSVNDLLAHNKTYQAAELLVRGHKVATSKQLMLLKALDDIREEIANRRKTLFEQIIEDLINMVYSGTSIMECPQAQRAAMNSHFEKLISSLRALQNEQDLMLAIAKRMPEILDRLVLKALVASQSVEREIPADDEYGGLANRFQSRDGTYTGEVEVLFSMLPSTQAPQWSKDLCQNILDRVRVFFADTLENHSLLLAKVSPTAAKELSSAAMWNSMQQKLIDLGNVLVGSVILTVKDAFRKQLGATKRTNFITIDNPALEFSFLPRASMQEKMDLQISIIDVVRSMPGLVPSKYNVPELRHSLLRSAPEGTRKAPEASNLLVAFAEELVTKELMTKLHTDLNLYIECLAGSATNLINMEALVLEDNASLPSLPAVVGIEKVFQEVVALSCNTGSHPAQFASEVLQFLGAFRNRCFIALKAAESWTAAGALLSDATFIGEMQSRMQMFFLQTAALRRDMLGKRAPIMPDLQSNSANDRLKFAALQNALDDLNTDEGTTLAMPELKALVRFISSLYLIVRMIENPNSFSTPSETEATNDQNTNLLQKEKEKQRQQARKKVTRQLLQSLTSEAGRLLEVADKGVMLLRIDMQTKVYLSLCRFAELARKTVPKQSEAQQLGIQLGKELVDFERVVKFNLDVAKREYIFNDTDSVFAAFLEQIKAKLISARALNQKTASALRHFVGGTQRVYELLNELSDSASLRALSDIEAAAARS
mmetsp:Transcript_7346/g.22399  ORF Transcript_7346/g.22399 Transcript_7346/m.22399 type:complete len:859 (+) Transcript_7346:255-2831(+)